MELSFAVSGGRLARDHSFALWQALERAAPWLAGEQALAVLPVRAAASGDFLLLNRRSRLLMRLPEARIAAALELCGRRLEVAGEALHLGKAASRPLAAHATLYSHRVAAEATDEREFVAQVARQLGELGIHAEFIVGRRSSTRGPGGTLTGFSLMLAALPPRVSLALQAAGLGAHRKLGFGVFLGHRFIAAVGSEELEHERRTARNT